MIQSFGAVDFFARESNPCSQAELPTAVDTSINYWRLSHDCPLYVGVSLRRFNSFPTPAEQDNCLTE